MAPTQRTRQLTQARAPEREPGERPPAIAYGVAGDAGTYVLSCDSAISAAAPTLGTSAAGRNPPLQRSTSNPAPTHSSASASGYTNTVSANNAPSSQVGTDASQATAHPGRDRESRGALGVNAKRAAS